LNPFNQRKKDTAFEKQRRKKRLPPTKELLAKARESEEEEETSERYVPDGLTWWKRNALTNYKDDCRLYTVNRTEDNKLRQINSSKTDDKLRNRSV
jgi:hypothetical protein